LPWNVTQAVLAIFPGAGGGREGLNGVGDRESRPAERIVRDVMSIAEPVAKIPRPFSFVRRQ